MLWYTHKSKLALADIDLDSILVVLAETPSVVMDTLLVRPSDKKTDWASTPDLLDLTRMTALTVVGTLHKAVLPTRVPNGYWGFGMSAGVVQQGAHSIDARFEQQLNLQAGVADHLVRHNTGSLLWISNHTKYQKGSDLELRSAWTIAPATDFLKATEAIGASADDPAVVALRLGDNSLSEDKQALAGDDHENYGLATSADASTLESALGTVVTAHPYVAPVV
jgi:hypothetical protein